MKNIQIQEIISHYEDMVLSVQKLGVEALTKAYHLEMKQLELEEASGLSIDKLIEKYRGESL